MIQILRKEVSSYFSSLVAYMVIVVFLVSLGLITWVFPQSSVLEYGYASLDSFFGLVPYVFMFMIPAITMRSFAEEKRTGTIELLLTRPLTDWQIILGKYFACLALVAFALLPTLIYYFSIVELGSPKGNIDTAAVAGSYLGLLLLGGVFTAIGILASAFSDNQIVAFIMAVFLSFFLYDGFSSLAAVNVWAAYSYAINQIGIDFHYATISKGLVAINNVFYFLTVIIIMLAGTRLLLGARKW